MPFRPDRAPSGRAGECQREPHWNAERATDAAVLGGRAKRDQPCVVERTVQDQLSIDRDEPALRLRRVESGREATENPLMSFGEPPNVGERSGADGAQ